MKFVFLRFWVALVITQLYAYTREVCLYIYMIPPLIMSVILIIIICMGEFIIQGVFISFVNV